MDPLYSCVLINVSAVSESIRASVRFLAHHKGPKPCLVVSTWPTMINRRWPKNQQLLHHLRLKIHSTRAEPLIRGPSASRRPKIFPHKCSRSIYGPRRTYIGNKSVTERPPLIRKWWPEPINIVWCIYEADVRNCTLQSVSHVPTPTYIMKDHALPYALRADHVHAHVARRKMGPGSEFTTMPFRRRRAGACLRDQ